MAVCCICGLAEAGRKVHLLCSQRQSLHAGRAHLKYAHDTSVWGVPLYQCGVDSLLVVVGLELLTQKYRLGAAQCDMR